MSYLLISDLIESGKRALTDGHQWCALSMALMLPSMCSRLEFENDSDYFEIKRGKKRWFDKKAYVDWCKKYIFHPGYALVVFGNEGPDILYLLRCDMVHAGYADVYYRSRNVYLSINDVGATPLMDRLIIDVSTLCNLIFDAVANWCSNFGADNFHYTFVFDKNNYDDMLLYHDLCDKERLSVLREVFNSYEQNRQDESKK